MEATLFSKSSANRERGEIINKLNKFINFVIRQCTRTKVNTILLSAHITRLFMRIRSCKAANTCMTYGWDMSSALIFGWEGGGGGGGGGGGALKWLQPAGEEWWGLGNQEHYISYKSQY